MIQPPGTPPFADSVKRVQCEWLKIYELLTLFQSSELQPIILVLIKDSASGNMLMFLQFIVGVTMHINGVAFSCTVIVPKITSQQ